MVNWTHLPAAAGHKRNFHFQLAQRFYHNVARLKRRKRIPIQDDTNEPYGEGGHGKDYYIIGYFLNCLHAQKNLITF